MITFESRLKITAAFLALLLVAAALLPLTAEAAVTITEYGGITAGSYPYGITTGPDGALWFTEGSGNKIGLIDPSTHVVNEFPVPTAGSNPADITSRLEEAGQLMGIPLLDHLIIGRNGGYYSFADAGDISHETSGYRGMVLRENE